MSPLTLTESRSDRSIFDAPYPRDPLAPSMLDKLAHYLSTAVSMKDGRTYAGGLEPREMERLLVPTPEMLGVMLSL